MFMYPLSQLLSIKTIKLIVISALFFFLLPGTAFGAYGSEKITPNMISVLFGATAVEAYKYKAAASGGGATVAVNSPAIISSGLPLFAGLSYRIGYSDVYLGLALRFLNSKQTVAKHFAQNIQGVKSVAFFSSDVQVSYSLHRLLGQSWLDVQTGIGLGNQSMSFTDKDNDKVSMAGIRLSLNALQVRILLHPNFFVFLNNTVAFAFLKPNDDSDTKLKAISMQYELSTGLAFSF